ncbi:hypothetical protein EW146_g4760 [Bondarzewia mesenterica]|uniref:Uncharacterized protein n=1 Tax=Bondarzewia mesenterica TaxID=1095465 RepID=A0A4S4LU22_9AGAM|nr:hypothetical protein EW146_g4760 [Bondarzewia mesenterica]
MFSLFEQFAEEVPLGDRPNLLRNCNNKAPLRITDGHVGAFTDDGAFFIMSPNIDWIPLPPLGVMWENNLFLYHGAIPDRPKTGLSPYGADRYMWLNSGASDREVIHEGDKAEEGLGTLGMELLLSLTGSMDHMLKRATSIQ